jgi:hypothetical protein
MIACGALFAILFVCLPIRDGADGFMGPVQLKALVFIPLAVVAGLAFLFAGSPVLEAFQARPKSKGQLTLVLAIILGSAALTALAYWQVQTRWLRPPEPGRGSRRDADRRRVSRRRTCIGAGSESSVAPPRCQPGARAARPGSTSLTSFPSLTTATPFTRTN